MTRYAMTTDGLYACPTCAAHGIETATSACEPHWEDVIRIDDGCTEWLVGVPCRECREQGVVDGSDGLRYATPGEARAWGEV